MDNGPAPLTPDQQQDMEILLRFVALYCRHHHDGAAPYPAPAELAGRLRKPLALCPECRELVDYGLERRRRCPLEPKPSCKKCPVHCYRPAYREQVRRVMAWSGKRMLLRGRLDYLWHYFF